MINNVSEVSAFPHLLIGKGGVDIDKRFHDSIIVLGQDPEYANKQSFIIVYDEDGGQELFHQAIKLRAKALGEGHEVSFDSASETTIKMIWENFKKKAPVSADVEDDSELQRFFMQLLGRAKDENVSDIHIEVRKDSAKLRYRINGELVNIDEWPRAFAFQLAQVVYSVIASEVDVTFKPDQPQDGVIDRKFGDERLRVRLATIPAAPDGFDMIMRLLPIGKTDGTAKIVPIDSLGYSEDQVKMIKAGVAKPVGLTLIAGTTGSGKSTTLKYILLDKINTSHGTTKVITVEDPPEYYIPGATQVPVVRSKAEKGTNPFAAAIRAAMRSDPNILMVGEVRDAASCDLLTNAVQSGHQVLSTVHASSAIGIVGRLANMGLRRDILGSPDFLGCLVYQKLLPTLCPHCSVPISDEAGLEGLNIDDNMMHRLSVIGVRKTDNVRFRNYGNDCEHCRYGVVGRAVVAEVILPDFKMLDMIHEGRDMDAWRHWRASGGKPALQHGIEKMMMGQVSPGDIEAELGPITALEVMKDDVFDMNAETSYVGPGNKAENEKRENVGLGDVEMPELDEHGMHAAKAKSDSDNNIDVIETESV